MITKQCEKCKKKIKERDYEEHIDTHTPFWDKKRITLSGADQIRIMLKSSHKSWSELIKHTPKQNISDIEKAKILRQFEKENNITFNYRSFDDTISFIAMTTNEGKC